MWEIATRRRLARVTHDNDRDITTVAFRPDGRALATASLDGTARVWSLRAADLVAEAWARRPRDLEARVQREYLRGERPGKILPGPSPEPGPTAWAAGMCLPPPYRSGS